MALDKYMIKLHPNLSSSTLKEVFNLNSRISMMVKKEVLIL